jgi:hypothetical protein
MIGCREENRNIEDAHGVSHEYYVRQLPATQGEILKFKLLAMVGPALRNLKIEGDIEKNPDIAMSIFGEVLAALFDKNPPETVFKFLRSIVINAKRDGVVILDTNFDEIYTDNMQEFYKACMLVLEVNFANFFKGWKFGGLLERAKKLTA